jgi:prepilin-type processing-associated H-X9-DG protein
MYVQDFDDTFPPVTYTGARGQTQPDNAGTFRWPWLVQPYVKNMQLARCPSQSPTFVHAQCGGGCLDPGNSFYGYLWSLFPNYGYNWGYLAPDPAAPSPGAGVASNSRGQSLAAIGSPAETVMLADSIWTPNGEPNTTVLGYFLIYPPNQWAGAPPVNGFSYGRVWPRHQNRASVAFADGHVKALSIDQLQDESLWDRN